jgi:hypothetical protein
MEQFCTCVSSRGRDRCLNNGVALTVAEVIASRPVLEVDREVVEDATVPPESRVATEWTIFGTVEINAVKFSAYEYFYY